MCSHYTFTPDKELIETFKRHNQIELKLTYDVFPGMEVPIIQSSGPTLMEWGIYPYWQDRGQRKKPIINARIETMMEKPSFKSLVHNRCLIPASGYFEWKENELGKKIPYLITITHRPIFYFAGIFNATSFSIITTKANQKLSLLHPRMPMIVPQHKEWDWLHQSTATFKNETGYN